MAGGIDWFRWHHGSTTDLKFQLVAKRSGATVAEVIAVWASLLEAASASARRGLAGVPDFEALDCGLGLDEGKAQAIFTAMLSRDLVTADGSIVAWERRQPKREREDDNSTDRVREFRRRQRQVEPGNANETPSGGDETHETPRVEERREEQPSVVGAAKSPRPTRKCPEQFAVTAEMREWAARSTPGVEVDLETAKFRDHTFRTAISDWPGTWRNWLRRAFQDRPVARAGPSDRRREPADIYGTGS
jgi:hypothetical protein